MRALTVRQPYADSIAWGSKRTENRSKPIPAKYIGVPVLLHAAKDPHASGITATDLHHATGDPIHQWSDTRSAVLAVVRFQAFHRPTDAQGCCRPWGKVETTIHPVVWHWQIAEVVRLAEPVPASGALSFWTVPDNVLAAVQRQIDLERASA